MLDPEQRARFDVEYDKQKNLQWQIFEQGAALTSRDDDQRIFHGVLSLLYAARRRDPEMGGLGGLRLERMLGVPREHLEFPIWYLRKRGWVETLHTGELAITVDGIDNIVSEEKSMPQTRLLREAPVPDPGETAADPSGGSAAEG